MENNSRNLGDILAKNYFTIPNYQRAYAWDAEQLNIFMDDLKNYRSFSFQEKPYFLGTFLFSVDLRHHSFTNYFIVDGQQRLTTSILYVACLLRFLNKRSIETSKWKELFIGDRSCRRLKAIEPDNAFFDQYALEGNLNCKAETPSQKKLQKAIQVIETRLSEMDSATPTEELVKDIETLQKARILTYTVNSEAEATQIFEFQNDRGKKLTDLEVIKSFLMHSVYVYCEDARRTEGILGILQNNFTKIYRTLESMADLAGRLNEDAILSHHITSYLPNLRFNGDKDGASHPKEFIKYLLSKKENNNERIKWIENFSENLENTFNIVKDILLYRDEYEDLGALFVLDRVSLFWPLLIKTWHLDSNIEKNNFKQVVKLCARFAFRSAISGLRSNTGVEHLRREANHLHTKDFSDLIKNLTEMCETWWDIGTKFLRGLDERNIYHSRNQVKFLLWKYENYLRARNGRHAQHALTWRDMTEKNGNLQMTVDHILPQNPSDPNERTMLEREISLRAGEKPQSFRNLYLHCLGNLVLDTRGGNSSNGCRRFSQKTDDSRYGFMQSQAELKSFSTNIEIWDEVSITNRQEKLKEFAMKI
ncbi:MAG: DUF262 domain-containing protein [SAR324 cluster bacterium]|uniref:DUF262 domain-containing protein n=1 Tax=SAR324 cluster bacterium TaxID=2024889 RepID=A0A7X9IKR5_9DELT|nr:DUF262 domain-containing protein [SAR324 cluster bacterium]